MKVLIITPSAENAHVVKWVAAAAGYGHQIELLCLRQGPNPTGVPRTVVPTEVGVAQKLVGRWRFVWTCRQRIRRFRPDLVHVHFMDPTQTVLGWWAARPLLVTVWGSDISMPRAIWNEGFRRLGLRAATRVTVTNPLLEYLVRAHLGQLAPVDVVPFGVDTERFRPIPSPDAGVFRVAFVKHLEPIYGLDTLLRAMVDVRAAHPASELWVVGTGSWSERYQELARTLGLHDVVRFLGPKPNAEVPDLLSQCQVLAMPSRSESFGVTALEAAACGLPVVASRVGGVADVVADGVTGFLVPPDNPAALAERLLWLARNTQEAKELGLAGRTRVCGLYEWKDCAVRMETIYQDLVRSGAGSASNSAE